MHRLALRKLRRRRQHAKDLNRARRKFPHGVPGLLYLGGPTVAALAVTDPLERLLRRHIYDCFARHALRNLRNSHKTVMSRYAATAVDLSLYSKLTIGVDMGVPGGDRTVIVPRPA